MLAMHLRAAYQTPTLYLVGQVHLNKNGVLTFLRANQQNADSCSVTPRIQ
jgi:hypothetical protein